MEHQDLVGDFLKSPGVEIGAFMTPIPGISPIYVDRFSEYANQPTLAEYFGDSAELPFHDSSLLYVATSHVIEHVANPLQALLEWYRVLKDGGIIYMVVPDRRFTFDRMRPLTDVDHMVEDYRNHTTQSDSTHIEDYVLNVEWQEFSPKTPLKDIAKERQSLLRTYKQAIDSNSEINIHFHTFQPETMVELIKRANDVLPLDGGSIEVIRVEAGFPASRPDGFLVIAKTRKPTRSTDADTTSMILKSSAIRFTRPGISDQAMGKFTEKDFPETRYLEIHKDVHAAVGAGQFDSGFMHYQLFGKKEGRRLQ